MIIVAERIRHCRPMWYQRRVYNRLHELALANPGFHRVVIQIKPAPPHDTEHMVTPNIEPEIRRLLAMVWILEPAASDDDPMVML